MHKSIWILLIMLPFICYAGIHAVQAENQQSLSEDGSDIQLLGSVEDHETENSRDGYRSTFLVEAHGMDNPGGADLNAQIWRIPIDGGNAAYTGHNTPYSFTSPGSFVPGTYYVIKDSYVDWIPADLTLAYLDMNYSVDFWGMYDAPPVYDLGFRPNPDGWNFTNNTQTMWPSDWWSQFNYWAPIYSLMPGWGPLISILCSPSDFPDWPLFVSAYGEDYCYWQLPPQPEYSPIAVQKWLSRNGNYEGSCYGFSISSLWNFSLPTDFQVHWPNLGGYNELHDLPYGGNTNLCINEIQIYQFGQQCQNYATQNRNKTPNQTLADLYDMFTYDQANPRAIYLKNQNGNGAHSVVPYRIEVSDSVYVKVYDPNHPNIEQQRIAVDTSTTSGTWSYVVNLHNWGGPNAVKGFRVEDNVSECINDPHFRSGFRANQDFVSSSRPYNYEIYNPSELDITISNDANQSIGYIGGIQHNDLPVGIHIIPITGTETPPIGYYLPEARYNIQMNDFNTNENYINIFKDNECYFYSRSDASPSQEDWLVLDNGLTVASLDTADKNIKLGAIRKEIDHEVVYLVEQFILSQADSLRLECVADTSAVLRRGADTPGSYNLKVSYLDSAQALDFIHLGIGIEANSTHYISPDVTGLDSVSISIDNGSDGTIDETVSLEDQYQGPNLILEVNSFTAELVAPQNHVLLSWESGCESGLSGYYLLRNTQNDLDNTVIVSPMILATNTSTPQNYTFTDTEVEIGNTYYYWLQIVDLNGASGIYGPINILVQSTGVNDEIVPSLPGDNFLGSAWPNPFRESAQIKVGIKAGELGTVTVYNIHGQAVKTFTVREGDHVLTWNGSDNNGNVCGSGIYFYRLSTPSFQQTRKMVIIK